MRLRRWILGPGEVLGFRDEAAWRAVAEGDALLVRCDRRQALATHSYVPCSLWMPINGPMRVAGRELKVEVSSDDVWLAEHGARLSVHSAGGAGASMLGVLLPPERVRAIARRELGIAPEDPVLFPGRLRDDPLVTMPLLRLAQATGREPEQETATLIDDLVARLCARQRADEALVDRCPGRSARYRRQVYLRLLRAHQHIEFARGADCSLANLAEIAKLSPTHFLRLYRDVFGQTPHKQVVVTRLSAARELLLHTELGIAEVCRTLGFENRCAFARVFKQHYGLPPTAMRQLATDARRGGVTTARPESMAMAA